MELLQFPHSHYNEKVRWALDYKAIPHRRRNLLPGPHVLTARRLTGQNQVPVLRFDGRALAGSARIIDELEHRFPEPALYPADPEHRRRALEIQTWFDEEVGPRVRRAIFAVLLDYPGYVARTFSFDRSALVRIAYRAVFPLIVRGGMKPSMGIRGEASTTDALNGTREAFDFVADKAGSAGYLVGESFSIADLAAAAILAPASNPPDSTMTRLEPMPEPASRWLEQWADHSGRSWVLEQYRRHRKPRG